MVAVTNTCQGVPGPEQTNHALLKIIRDNISSQYASKAALLTKFRDAVSAHGTEDDVSLLADFRTHVPLSEYDSYKPFVDKFKAQLCNEEDVIDLFSPGLPDFLAVSSATSGTTSKILPKYEHDTRPGNAVRSNFGPRDKLPLAGLYCTEYRDIKVIQRASGEVVRKIPVCIASGGYLRRATEWYCDDESRMCGTVPGYAVPWAATTIGYFPSFLIIHSLFFLARKDIGRFRIPFATQFLDLVRHINEHWDMLVSCIRDGRLPDLKGINHVRGYLQFHIHADPERATELLKIGPPFSCEGWFACVWPNANELLTTCSGPFATVLPKVKSILGPNVSLRGPGYGATEGYIGYLHDGSKLDEFVLQSEEIIEFLDVSLDATHQNLRQPWEVEVGKYYEPVLTTRDGLWQYRLGDVLHIIGFENGGNAPLFKYSGRKWATLRIPGRLMQIAEYQLVAVIQAISSDDAIPIQEFTTLVDDRTLVSTVGFFVESAGPLGPNAHLAPQQLFDALVATNAEHKRSLKLGKIRLPTIRIVKPGTFAEYRQWKGENANIASGQIKVPVVLLNPTVQEWFSERVVQEI